MTNLSYLPPLGNSDHICIQFDVLCYSEYKKADNIRYNARAADIDIMKEALIVSLTGYLLVLHRYAYFHFYRYRCFTHSCSRYADIYRYSSIL